FLDEPAPMEETEASSEQSTALLPLDSLTPPEPTAELSEPVAAAAPPAVPIEDPAPETVFEVPFETSAEPELAEATEAADALAGPEPISEAVPIDVAAAGEPFESPRPAVHAPATVFDDRPAPDYATEDARPEELAFPS